MRLFRITLLILLSLSSINAQAAIITGSIEFAHRIRLSLPVSGTVQTVNARSGQAINKGELLLNLDPILFKSSVIQATSQLIIHDADHKESKRDLDHAMELFDRGVLSSVELQKATLNEARAQARKAISEAKLQRAQYLFDNSAIISPFDGWVLDIKVRVGEIINNTLSTQVMLVIAQGDWYSAIFTLNRSTIKNLKLASTIKVNVAGKRYSGTITATDLEPDDVRTGPKARYKIHITFNSRGDLLRSGETASINLAD